MKNVERAAVFCFFAVILFIVHLCGSEALAQSSYFSSQGCSGVIPPR